jgi:hypothetical protein
MINTIEILVSIVNIIVDHAGNILACLWDTNVLSVAGCSAAVFIILGFGLILE